MSRRNRTRRRTETPGAETETEIVKKDDLDPTIIQPLPDEDQGMELEGAAEPEEDPYEKLRQEHAALQTERRAEQQRREAAERRAQEAEDRFGGQETETIQAHKALLEHAIVNAGNRANEASRKYSAALSVGDYDTAAEAQRDITRAELDLQKLEEGRGVIAEREKLPRRQAAPPAAPQPQDPIEALKVNPNVPQASKEWLLAHPDVVTDPELQADAIHYHNKALRKGLVADSDAYFDYLEEQLGYVDEAEAPPPPPTRKPATQRVGGGRVAAPVSRGSAPGRGSDTVTLTAEQKNYARRMGMSEKEYSDNLREIKSGKSGLMLTKDLGDYYGS